MGKIQVEDLTQPPSAKDRINIVVNAIFIYAARFGLAQKLHSKNIVRAIMASAELMGEYTRILGDITDEEILEARKEAISFSKDRCKELKEQGFFNLIKRHGNNWIE